MDALALLRRLELMGCVALLKADARREGARWTLLAHGGPLGVDVMGSPRIVRHDADTVEECVERVVWLLDTWPVELEGWVRGGLAVDS